MEYMDYQVAEEELAQRRRQAERRQLARQIARRRGSASPGSLLAIVVARVGSWMIETGCRLQSRATELKPGLQSMGAEVAAQAASSQPSRTGC